MADQYTVVTKKGYGQRIGNSLKNVGVGLLLFFGSFAVLYWNEGRVDISSIAVNAVEVSADQVAADANGKLVYTYGAVNSEETLGDNLFLISGDYLAVSRLVEMYAWVENSSTSSDTNFGGSETETTTYTYTTNWVDEVDDSQNFQVPLEHYNPAKIYESETTRATDAKLGAYTLDFDKLQLPDLNELAVNDTNTTVFGGAKLSGDYVYIPTTQSYSGTLPEGLSVGSTITGSLTSPQVGDMRVSYFVLPNNYEGTIFGKLEGEKIVNYVDLDDTGESLYRLFDGTRDEAIAMMHGEYKMMLWIFRAVGFVMMWMGLSLFFGPLSTLLDIVPFFGSLSRAVVGVISLVVSLVLSVVTILISMIVQNIVVLVVTLVVLVGIFVFILKKKGTKPTVVRV